MAKQPPARTGTWNRVEEYLEAGDPTFVDELRSIHEAPALAKFAASWYRSKDPHARPLLLAYLQRPLSAYRHEPLVKRLFKRAESAGDDEVMAHFLVLFDRSVRRVPKKVRRSRNKQFKSREAAKAEAARWRAQGWKETSTSSWGKQFFLRAWKTEETFVVPPDNTMPRPPKAGWSRPVKVPPADKLADWEERCRLFSPRTRNYLRRRAWRYFRTLGKEHPERYVPAIATALKLYEDADVASGLALLDNWGLMHALFHHCPALVAKASGWRLADRHTLRELAPAAMYEELWKEAPRALIDLMKEARCRPVRQWAIFMVRRDHGAILAALPLDELIDLLGHEDAEVVGVATKVLRERPDLDTLPVERWLALLESATPQAVEVLCELAMERLRPERLSLEQVVALAASRPLPVARLAFAWLQAREAATEAECRLLLGLVDAQAEPLRPALVRWARGLLSASPHFRPDWVLEYLDSRHRDVRGEGWLWLRDEPRAADNTDLWQRLLESPYDDVRLLLLADLEDRVASADAGDGRPLDAGLVRLLWATVLLNIHRGGRSKPLAVRQLVRRLQQRPKEAPALLPLLSVALRSVRGPEWRAGLAGVVQLVENNPNLRDAVQKAFPELELELVTSP